MHRWQKRMFIITEQAQLVLMAEVSHRIKALVQLADRLQLASLNARIKARVSKVSVPGFDVLTERMQERCTTLVCYLRSLRSSVERWIRLMSARISRRRMLDLLSAASGMNERSAAVISPVVSRLHAAAATAVAERAAREEFTTYLRVASGYSSSSSVIARNTLIEASHGRQVAEELRDSAATLIELSDEIEGWVLRIERQLLVLEGVQA